MEASYGFRVCGYGAFCIGEESELTNDRGLFIKPILTDHNFSIFLKKETILDRLKNISITAKTATI